MRLCGDGLQAQALGPVQSTRWCPPTFAGWLLGGQTVGSADVRTFLDLQRALTRLTSRRLYSTSTSPLTLAPLRHVKFAEEGNEAALTYRPESQGSEPRPRCPRTKEK